MDEMAIQFSEEIGRFYVDFWETAELVGYPESEENALHLRLVYSKLLLDQAEDAGIEISGKLEGLLVEHPFGEGGELESLLGHALTFYSLADHERSIGLLVFASQSLGLARAMIGSGVSGFDEGLLKYALSLIGRKGAAAAHVETNRLKNEVVAYWRASVNRDLSNEKAATELLKQFPLSHRTLRDYVAEAKRNIRPAGKA